MVSRLNLVIKGLGVIPHDLVHHIFAKAFQELIGVESILNPLIIVLI